MNSKQHTVLSLMLAHTKDFSTAGKLSSLSSETRQLAQSNAQQLRAFLQKLKQKNMESVPPYVVTETDEKNIVTLMNMFCDAKQTAMAGDVYRMFSLTLDKSKKQVGMAFRASLCIDKCLGKGGLAQMTVGKVLKALHITCPGKVYRKRLPLTTLAK